MTRLLRSCALALPLVTLCAGTALADVKSRDRTQVKFEGLLGRVVGMFGGKAARDGVVVTNAVKGDRKAEMTDTTGRIVDLKEEKIYELDLKRKTYEVITFDELRRRLREAREKAARDMPKEERETEAPDRRKPEREIEVDFDVKQTGQTRQIAGYSAREVLMTVTVREKGRTLEDSGGLVLTSNSWMGPEIPAMKEMADFEMRYWKAIVPEATGVSPEQMATIMAMYPMLKDAMERMKTEGNRLEGTPLASTMVFEAVKSKAQITEESRQTSGGGRSIGGMLASRMMKREEKPRATILTITHETLEVTPSVADADLAIPAGFKEKK